MKSVYGVGGVPGVGNPAVMNALLASQQFLMADLYTFTLANGTVLRYTTFDGNLTVLGNVFSSVGPFMTRGNTRTLIGVEVDTLQVNFLVNASVQINGQPLAQFVSQGGFDGGSLQLWRTFMPIPTTPGTAPDPSAGYLIQFVGGVAEVMPSRSEVQMNVNSDLQLLSIMLPRNLYQATCIHALFDAGCTLLKSAFAAASSVLAGGTTMLINCGLAQAAGYFDQGTIAFTSGSNNGISRTVKSYTVGALNLSYPLYNAPTIGDTFNAYPGCDKLQTTCSVKFSNLVNFRGFPYIPLPETSY